MTPHSTPPDSGLPRRTILLNSSSLKLTHCQQRYRYIVVDGLKPHELHEYLTFGKAIHKFAETRQSGMSTPVAMAEAMAEYTGKFSDKLALACAHMPPDLENPYVEPGGRRYLELKFKIYWKSIVYEGVQFDIYICGTFDKVSMFSDGTVRITDYKTTRKYSPADVFASYRVSVQMTFYLWVAQRFSYAIFDMPVANACHDCRMMLNICGVFVSHPQPTWKYGPPIQISLPELDHFERLLDAEVMSTLLPAHLNARQNGRINDTCDGCEFKGLCFATNETQYNQELAAFKHEPYDPSLW